MPKAQQLQQTPVTLEQNKEFVIRRWLLGVSLLSCSAMAANRIEFTGVTGERVDNVNLYLARFEPAQINKSARFKARVAEQIRLALRAHGHYTARIEFEDKMDGDDLVLIAHVKATKYTFIDVLDLQMRGEAVKDADFLDLQHTQAPKQGDRLHHGVYEAYKKALMTLAQRKGYFDAKFDIAEFIVTPGKREAKMRLYFNSGKRYRFGDVTFHGSQISDERLRSLIPFQRGDFYTTDLLGKLNQNISSTLWFGSVDVDADPQKRHDGLLDLNIGVTPAIQNTVETGVGYVTDVGPRLKLSWDKPWLNSRGHSLKADMALSNNEQSLETTYKFPLKDVQHDYYQAGLALKHTNLLDTESRLANLKLERQWYMGDDWYRIASIRWLHEDYRQALQRDVSNLILPGISVRHSFDSGGSMPMQAQNILVSMEMANQAWGADTDFTLLRARAGRIGSFDSDSRYLLRADAGAILQEQLDSIPASLRFFAGGDYSVRGYGYQTISPVDAEGNLTGGIRLAAATAEYQWRYRGNWWLATFADVGSVWNDQPEWKKSVGVGIRWASPIGPIRLDLAYGLDKEPSPGLRLHFTLGPEL